MLAVREAHQLNTLLSARADVFTSLFHRNPIASHAEDASTWDMFGGGAMMDMMERSALADAQRQADTARMLVMQAYVRRSYS